MVIAHAETRELAIARLIAALQAFPILGIITNIPFLIRVLEHPRFRAGEIHTGFLDHEGASLSEPVHEATPPFVSAAISAATAAHGPGGAATQADWDPWGQLSGWRP
jgi:3-methylcrotonyl-CoA carboxylase alpha subunit